MKIAIVDDEASVRRALSRLLRSAGYEVAAFASADEFLDSAPLPRPTCVVLDMAMPDQNGLAVQEKLREMNHSIPVIFLTGRADIAMCATAMKRGASDFLTKPVNDEDLLAAIQRALESDRVYCAIKASRADVQHRLASLTAREREVLDRVILGKLNKQIAAELGAAEKTVKVHRGRMMKKMNVASVAELTRLMERLSLA